MSNTNIVDIEEIRQALKTKRANIVFEKKDGSIRTMLCTLQERYLPPIVIKEGEEAKPPRDKTHDSLLTVWDLEKAAWRAFYAESVKSVEYIDDTLAEV